MNNHVTNKEEFGDYLQKINQIAEDNSLSQPDKIKMIIAAYDAEVKRILYTDQGLTPPGDFY